MLIVKKNNKNIFIIVDEKVSGMVPFFAFMVNITQSLNCVLNEIRV